MKRLRFLLFSYLIILLLTIPSTSCARGGKTVRDAIQKPDSIYQNKAAIKDFKIDIKPEEIQPDITSTSLQTEEENLQPEEEGLQPKEYAAGTSEPGPNVAAKSGKPNKTEGKSAAVMPIRANNGNKTDAPRHGNVQLERTSGVGEAAVTTDTIVAAFNAINNISSSSSSSSAPGEAISNSQTQAQPAKQNAKLPLPVVTPALNKVIDALNNMTSGLTQVTNTLLGNEKVETNVDYIKSHDGLLKDAINNVGDCLKALQNKK